MKKPGLSKHMLTRIKRLGSEEAARAEFARAGSLGGKSPTDLAKGFAKWKLQGRTDLIAEAGRTGGRTSRRPKR